MAANELLIHINGDPKGFNSAINKAASESKNLEKNLKTVALAASAAFVGLAAAVGGSLAKFREQEKVENQLNAVIASTGSIAGITANEIKTMASQLQGITTFGDEAIISSSNLLLTFKQIGGDTFPRAQKAILDVSTAMGQDLKSTTIQLGKALNDPIEGLSALSRVGITFSEQQQEVIKSLSATGQTAAAQGLILDELESQFAGSAESAAQGTGQIIQLRNAIGDFAEKVGAVFAPIIASTSQILTSFITKLNENEEVFLRLGKALAITGVIIGTVAGITILSLAFFKLTSLVSAVGSIFISLATLIVNPLGLAFIGIASIVGILIFNFDKIEPALLRVASVFSQFNVQLTTTGTVINSLGKIAAGVFGFISEFVIGQFNSMLTVIAGFGTALQGVFSLDPALIAAGISEAGVAMVSALSTNLFNAGLVAKQKFEEGFSLTNNVKGFDDLVSRSKEFVGSQVKTFVKFAADRVGIDTTLFADLQALFGGFANEQSLLATDRSGTLTSIEQTMADQLLAIDQALGDDQVNEYQSTSDELINAANARSEALRAAESASSGGGGVSSSSAPSTPGNTGRDILGVLAEDSEAGRAARRSLAPNTYNPLTGRNDLKDWLARALGPKFAQGFSGVMRGRDSIPGRFSPGEIIVPETFSQGLRKGRFALVGPGFGRGGMGSQVNVNFVSREAQRVITAETTKARSLGTFRGSR